MRPITPFPEGTKERMEILLKEAKTAGEIKRIQCILFRVREEYDNATIARQIGYSPDSVKNIHSRFHRLGETCLMDKKKWGRYHAHMTKTQEEEILSSCKSEGDAGGILEISTIQRAYEAKLGRQVHETIVYRMLHAHGWRKIAPRPAHPKRNQEKADEFKKNFQVFSPRNERHLWRKEEVSG